MAAKPSGSPAPDQLPSFSPERAAALEKAFAADPQNFQTAYDIGECYRTQSFDGGQNYESLAQTAMGWFSRGMKLNPYDSYNYLSYGMCLDWLETPRRGRSRISTAPTRSTPTTILSPRTSAGIMSRPAITRPRARGCSVR